MPAGKVRSYDSLQPIQYVARQNKRQLQLIGTNALDAKYCSIKAIQMHMPG